MKTKKLISLSADLAVIFLFVYFLIFPNRASASTRDALYFCGNTLVPSLFIYMILAKMVTSSIFIEKTAKKFGYEVLLLALGLLCGAPIGAKLAYDLYIKGQITKQRAEYFCSFSNNASISFVIGYVGVGLFGDIRIGLKLFTFQLISAISTAIIMRLVLFGKNMPSSPINMPMKKAQLSESLSDSAYTMLNLCACVIFFIVVGSAISRVFSLGSTSDAILKSILEFSSGCAAAYYKGIYSLPITAFSLGFTGCSVAMQVKSVSKGELSMMPYFAGKIINCAIFTILAIICG